MSIERRNLMLPFSLLEANRECIQRLMDEHFVRASRVILVDEDGLIVGEEPTPSNLSELITTDGYTVTMVTTETAVGAVNAFIVDASGEDLLRAPMDRRNILRGSRITLHGIHVYTSFSGVTGFYP